MAKLYKDRIYSIPNFPNYTVRLQPFRVISHARKRPLTLRQKKHSQIYVLQHNKKQKSFLPETLAALAFHGDPLISTHKAISGANALDEMNPKNTFWIPYKIWCFRKYAKLTLNEVDEIIKRYNSDMTLSLRDLAQEYGVSRPTISDALQRKYY